MKEIKLIDELHSPFTILSALAIVIIASARLSYALIAAIAILWQYISAVLITNSAKKYIPKIFNNLIHVMLFAVLGSIFYFVVYILNPFLAREMILVFLLVPVFCFSSNICLRVETEPLDDAMYRAIYEAILTGVFVILLSIVREPLGYATLSVPGGDYAIYELFNLDFIYPLPVQIIATSSGALLLLGYIFLVIKLTKAVKK